MADVHIDRYDAEEGSLPRLCMKCGEPADDFVFKQMQWHPQWVLVLLLAGLLPFIIVAVIMMKRIRLRAPMCRQHRNHWFSRSLTAGLSFLGLAIVCIGVLILASSRANRNANDAFFGLFCVGSLGLLLGWLILVAVMSHTSIRPKEITDHEVHLTNVSPIFVDELDYIYAEEFEERRERRRRRRPPGDEWDDEHPPPRRPAPPDSFEQDQ